VRLLGRQKVGLIKKVIAAGTVSATAPRTLIPSEENTRLNNLLAGVITRMKDREKILLRNTQKPAGRRI